MIAREDWGDNGAEDDDAGFVLDVPEIIIE